MSVVDCHDIHFLYKYKLLTTNVPHELLYRFQLPKTTWLLIGIIMLAGAGFHTNLDGERDLDFSKSVIRSVLRVEVCQQI